MGSVNPIDIMISCDFKGENFDICVDKIVDELSA